MKRFFDFLFSLLGLIVLSPIFLILALCVKLDSNGSIFFKQKRVGRHSKLFTIIKFRTMIVNHRDQNTITVSGDIRITRFGVFMRKYKLDELPQFFNIIKGEMSLVGPRPQVTYYTNKYEGKFKKILSIKPGLTDLASLYFMDMDKVLGDKNVDEKYATEIEPIKNLLRLKYVEEQSFFLDIRILIETAFRIIGIKNITGLKIKP